MPRHAGQGPASQQTPPPEEHFGRAETSSPSLPLFSPPTSLVSPTRPLLSISFSMADFGLCGAVGLRCFRGASQTHLGLDILFTSSQHSENHNNTELRQKFTAHYSLFRSRPRSNSESGLWYSFFISIDTCCHVILCEPNSRQTHLKLSRAVQKIID